MKVSELNVQELKKKKKVYYQKISKIQNAQKVDFVLISEANWFCVRKGS